jgi:hypothetical protein
LSEACSVSTRDCRAAEPRSIFGLIELSGAACCTYCLANYLPSGRPPDTWSGSLSCITHRLGCRGKRQEPTAAAKALSKASEESERPEESSSNSITAANVAKPSVLIATYTTTERTMR